MKQNNNLCQQLGFRYMRSMNDDPDNIADDFALPVPIVELIETGSEVLIRIKSVFLEANDVSV